MIRKCKNHGEMDIENFIRYKNDIRYRCKKCILEVRERWYAANVEKVKQKHFDYYRKNREKLTKYAHEYYVKNKEILKERYKGRYRKEAKK